MMLPAKRMLFPVGAGFVGTGFLTALYLGIVSLAGTPSHALDLFWEDKALVIPILLGFGIQVGLYALLRKGLHLPRQAPAGSATTAAGGATTAAGGGMSTVAMVACCAHHIADVLPLVGLTAAATFLANWKIPFMVVGLLTNLIGIGVMLRTIRSERRRGHARPVAVEAST